MSQTEGLKERQYGEWLKAGGMVRSGGEKGKASDGRNSDHMEGDDTRFKSKSIAVNFSSSIQLGDDGDGGWNSNNELAVKKVLNSETLTKDSNSNLSESDSLHRWDRAEETALGLRLS